MKIAGLVAALSCVAPALCGAEPSVVLDALVLRVALPEGVRPDLPASLAPVLEPGPFDGTLPATIPGTVQRGGRELPLIDAALEERDPARVRVIRQDALARAGRNVLRIVTDPGSLGAGPNEWTCKAPEAGALARIYQVTARAVAGGAVELEIHRVKGAPWPGVGHAIQVRVEPGESVIFADPSPPQLAFVSRPIPGLGSLPVLGALFRYPRRVLADTRAVVILSPRLGV